MGVPGSVPDGLVTIVFTDLEGSTAIRTTLGDADAEGLFAEHGAILREAIAANDGHDQGAGLGDGFVAVFTSTKRAVACALEIQDRLESFNRANPLPRLRVRVGVHAGEVSWRDGHLSGEAVHAAARVCGAAVGGQVLVSDVTRQLAGTIPDVEFRDAGEFALKGFPTPWRLYETRGPTGAEDRSRGVFVGRDEELGVLRRHLHAALDGQGGMVLIGGEPGVGKTTLVRQVIAEAERSGALAVFGRCYEAEGTIPYAPFVEMVEQALSLMPPELVRQDLGDDASEVARIVPGLRRRFPDIEPPLELPPEQQRRYLFNGVSSFVARGSERVPLLLVIDDIHWADQPSLLLIEHMASLVRDLRVLAIGTYRDVELDVSRPLAATVERLVRERLVHRVPVRRFGRDGVATMIEALAGIEAPGPVVEAIHAETEGNPFFVEEVYRHLVEEGRLFEGGRFRTDIEVDELDVPESVRLVVGRRLARLGTETQKVLAAGAVVGRAFSFDLLEHLVDADADVLLEALEEAEAAQVVVSEERDREVLYTFGHELIRQTLLAGLSVVRRQRLHLAVADAIESTDATAGQTRPSEIAGHLLRAGAAADPLRTRHLLGLAVDRAFEAAAFEEALRTLDQAIEISEPGDRTALARLRERRGQAARALGHFEEAIEIWDGVITDLASAGEVEHAGELSYQSAYQLAWLNRFDEAFAACARAAELVGEEPTSTRARSLGLAGGLLGLGGHHELASEQLVAAEAIARQLGDDRTLGFVLWARGLSEWTNLRLEEAIANGTEAIELLRRVNDQWTLVDALAWTSFPVALWRRDGRAEARALSTEALELGQRLGHRGGEALAVRGLVVTGSLWEGDVAGYEAECWRDLEAFSSIDSPWMSQSHALVATASMLRGDLDTALHHAERAVELEPQSGWACMADACLLLVRAWRNEAVEFEEVLGRVRSRFPPLGVHPSVGPYISVVWAVEACTVIGSRAAAAGLFPYLEALRGVMPVNGFDLSTSQRHLAMAASAAGHLDEADRLFEVAAARALDAPNVIEHLRAQHWHGEMLLDSGRPGDDERGRALLASSLDAATRLGIPLYAERARQRLAAG